MLWLGAILSKKQESTSNAETTKIIAVRGLSAIHQVRRTTDGHR